MDDKDNMLDCSDLTREQVQRILAWHEADKQLVNEQGFYAAMGICGVDIDKVPSYYKAYRDKLAQLSKEDV